MFETFSSDGWKNEGMTSVPQQSVRVSRSFPNGRPSIEVVVTLFTIFYEIFPKFVLLV